MNTAEAYALCFIADCIYQSSLESKFGVGIPQDAKVSSFDKGAVISSGHFYHKRSVTREPKDFCPHKTESQAAWALNRNTDNLLREEHKPKSLSVNLYYIYLDHVIFLSLYGQKTLKEQLWLLVFMENGIACLGFKRCRNVQD